ncbi:hypothetical protein E3E23_03650 [Thermococcus sp. CX2]|uniref:hypothetical protein n=1 Tax=Thermococcus sp. CX2 TaxID=163006 RepID=UPI001439D7BD|nr:hypothetical protein [Thermococcus sp. CX2]NJE84929.1 hypothetical protein [Thermococcus sp. CX2]
MSVDVYREALKLASSIRDKYLRAVTYARIGYYMYRSRNPRYKEAFKYAFNAAGSIDNPVLMVKAVIEIGTYLYGTGSKIASKVFQQAYESIITFPQPLRDDLLENLVGRLLELDIADDALFYVMDIEDNVKRNDLLLEILRVYLKKGNMRKAKIIIDRIEEEPWRSIGAIEAIKEHLKREEFGSAIRLLSEMKSEYWLGQVMKDVAVYLKTSDVPKTTYEKFVEIALSMSSETGFDVLKSLLVGLVNQGELEFVMTVLEKLSPDERLAILKDIVETSLDREEVLSRLLESLKGLEFEEVASFVIHWLLERPVDEKYRPLVEMIGNRTTDDALLVKVVTYLSKLRDFEDAVRFAQRVRGHYLRSLAFGSIAVARLKVGDIDGAIDAALEVKDPKWGSWLLSEILTKILELQTEGRIEEDIEKKAAHQKAFWEKH